MIVVCGTSSECPAARAVCESGVCRSCVNDTDCPDNLHVCDTGTGECRACIVHGECKADDKPFCENQVCIGQNEYITKIYIYTHIHFIFELHNEKYIPNFLSCRMSYKYRLPNRASCLQQWNLLR